MRFCFFFNVQAKEINEKEFKVLKAPLDEITISPVVFENKDSGFKLAGTVFAPKTMKSDDKLPAIIVQGPMGTTKEQTQSQNAFTRQGAEAMFENVASADKKLIVVPNAGHFDMYDGEEYAKPAIDTILEFFKTRL